jgi:hypothetical protein
MRKALKSHERQPQNETAPAIIFPWLTRAVWNYYIKWARTLPKKPALCGIRTKSTQIRGISAFLNNS